MSELRTSVKTQAKIKYIYDLLSDYCTERVVGRGYFTANEIIAVAHYQLGQYDLLKALCLGDSLNPFLRILNSLANAHNPIYAEKSIADAAKFLGDFMGHTEHRILQEELNNL
jgi:hypothetical protein